MGDAELKAILREPSFITGGGTVIGYVLIILVMAVLLFGVPYFLFTIF